MDQKFSDGTNFRVLDVSKIQFTINGLLRHKHLSTPAMKPSPTPNESIIFNVFTPKT